jgi:hypothetical protein
MVVRVVVCGSAPAAVSAAVAPPGAAAKRKKREGSAAPPPGDHRGPRPLLVGPSVRRAARSLSPWRRAVGGDIGQGAGGPPVASVLVQPSKLCDSLEKDRTDGESWSLSESDGASSSSELHLLVLASDDDDTLTLTEDSPKVQDELGAVAMAAVPSSTEKRDGDAATSSWMPAMERLVRTILDDPGARLTRSSCAEAALAHAAQQAELRRLRRQVQDLTLKPRQHGQASASPQPKNPGAPPGGTPGRSGSAAANAAASPYQVRDLSALQSLGDSQRQAQLRLRESYVKYWGAPPPPPPSLLPPLLGGSARSNALQEKEEEEEDPVLNGDYSAIIPLDSSRSASGSASSLLAVAEAAVKKGSSGRSEGEGGARGAHSGDLVAKPHRASPPSVAPTLPTAAPSEDASSSDDCRSSCGNSGGRRSSSGGGDDGSSSSFFTAAVVTSEELVVVAPAQQAQLLASADDCSHVSVRMAI